MSRHPPIIDTSSSRAFTERAGCDLTECERRLNGDLTSQEIMAAVITARRVAQCCEPGRENRATMDAAIEIMEGWQRQLIAGNSRAQAVINAKRSAVWRRRQ